MPRQRRKRGSNSLIPRQRVSARSRDKLEVIWFSEHPHQFDTLAQLLDLYTSYVGDRRHTT